VVLLILISPLLRLAKHRGIKSFEPILELEVKDTQYFCFILEFRIDLALAFENLFTSSFEQKQ
jgi:hypothetical protein